MSETLVKRFLILLTVLVLALIAGLGGMLFSVSERHNGSIADQAHAVALLRQINQSQAILSEQNDVVMMAPHLSLDRARLKAQDEQFRRIMSDPGLVRRPAGKRLQERILATDHAFMAAALGLPTRPSVAQAMTLDAQRDRLSSLVTDLAAVHSASLEGIIATEREQRDVTAGVFISFALSALALVLIGFVLLARLGGQRAHARALEVTDQLRNEFVSFAAHQLRNPATTINSGVYLLRRPDTDADTREKALDAMTQAASALGSLVMNLLNMGRVEEGRLQLHREPVLLSALIDGWLKEAEAYHPDLAGRVRVALPEMPVEVDTDYVCQVVSNILDNAVKHSPAGSPIEITGEVEDGMAAAHIRDYGEGIPADRLVHLFEKYGTTGDGAGARRGMGLGLYMARLLVEAHGGRIWAESTPGQGTTISFTLPLAPSGGPRQQDAPHRRAA